MKMSMKSARDKGRLTYIVGLSSFDEAELYHKVAHLSLADPPVIFSLYHPYPTFDRYRVSRQKRPRENSSLLQRAGRALAAVLLLLLAV
jgi:hypothetical protein